MTRLTGRCYTLRLTKINTTPSNLMIKCGMTTNTGKIGAFFRQMDILIYCWVNRIKPHITTLGPVTTTGFGMTTQT